MRAVCGAAADFAAGGYAVVLDGVLGPWFLHTLLDRCPPATFTINYLILLPPLEDMFSGIWLAEWDMGSRQRPRQGRCTTSSKPRRLASSVT